MIHKKLLYPVFCSLSLLVACSSDDPQPVEQTIDWQPCVYDQDLQCATLAVPIDYDAVDSETLMLSINRLQSSSADTTESLFFNPGGPGGSGTELIRVFKEASNIPDAIRARYHLVGFDPRGIGESRPVDCRAEGIDDLDDYLVDESAISAYVDQSQAAFDACLAKYGDYLKQLGSMNVVRDMEEMRKAMAQPDLHFIGYSYGTRLAALYLQMFPETSGRIVLDASISPDSSANLLAEGGLVAMQTNLENMLSQCSISEPECTGEILLTSLLTRINTLLQNEDEQTFEILGALLVAGVQEPEFADFLIAPLTQYLLNDDRDALFEFAQLAQEVFEDDAEDSLTAQYAVICEDDPQRLSLGELTSNLARYNNLSDLFAEASISITASCTSWPASTNPLPIITTRSAPQSLVIGGTSDAQTPVAWSEDMAASIGGVFIRSAHEGHTSVFNEKSACIDEMVSSFLLDGELPSTAECP
ncbi:MAG: alpha/beta hydrolase [Granulosicoccus sp.]